MLIIFYQFHSLKLHSLTLFKAITSLPLISFIIHIFYFSGILFYPISTHTSKIQINRRESNLMFTKVSKYHKYDQLYGRLLPIGCNKHVQLVAELKRCSRGSWHVSKLSRKFVTG